MALIIIHCLLFADLYSVSCFLCPVYSSMLVLIWPSLCVSWVCLVGERLKPSCKVINNMNCQYFTISRLLKKKVEHLKTSLKNLTFELKQNICKISEVFKQIFPSFLINILLHLESLEKLTWVSTTSSITRPELILFLSFIYVCYFN